MNRRRRRSLLKTSKKDSAVHEETTSYDRKAEANPQSKSKTKRRKSDLDLGLQSEYQVGKKKKKINDKDEFKSIPNDSPDRKKESDLGKPKFNTIGIKKDRVRSASSRSTVVKKAPGDKLKKRENTRNQAKSAKHKKAKMEIRGTKNTLLNKVKHSKKLFSEFNRKASLGSKDQNVRILRNGKEISINVGVVKNDKSYAIPTDPLQNQEEQARKDNVTNVSRPSDVHSTKDFSEFLLKTIDVKLHLPPPVSEESLPHLKPVGGISVTEDNLVWVNYILHRQVKLFDSCGKVLRTVDLDHSPYYNCCIPSGDLLLTQGTIRISSPDITLISRKGNVRTFAELTSYASKLCGILYQDNHVYVVGKTVVPRTEYIIQLSMKGEVQNIFDTKPDRVHFNQLVSVCSEILGIREEGFALYPLQRKCVSSKAVNKVFVNYAYSTSASVDNFENLVIGKMSKIIVVEPSLECLHEVETGFPDSVLITATAVDRQNQMWIGTGTGDLYITKYLN